MTHLGALGKQHEQREITFDYFGETLRAKTTITDLDFLEMMEYLSQIQVSDPKSLGVIKDFGRIALEDFDRFWSLARANGQSLEDVFEVLTKVLEAVTARPTGLPSGSSPGRQTVDTSSTVDQSLRPVMDSLGGRPDLQLMVVNAQSA